MEGTRHGRLIANQMLDVAIRVQAIRHFAVSQMVEFYHFVSSCMVYLSATTLVIVLV